MRISEFDLYKDLLHEKSGLVITPDESYMLNSRLTPVAKKWNFESLTSMTMALRGVADPALIRDVVEAMTTPETAFFRDMVPFETFASQILPALVKARTKTKKLRIWSAACSTGQEAYSLAIILKEREAQLGGWKIEILATDISSEALEFARHGAYAQFDVQHGLSTGALMKFFKHIGSKWQAKDDLRKLINFRFFNLMESMHPLGTFDAVLCCNVLENFDRETQRRVLDNMAGTLAKDGFLLLGHKEPYADGISSLAPVTEGLYVRAEAAAEAKQTLAT